MSELEYERLHQEAMGDWVIGIDEILNESKQKLREKKLKRVLNTPKK